MGERDYVIQIRDLVHQINTNVGPLSYLTKKQLNEATLWEPPYSIKEEKQLLSYLIDRGREYVQLRTLACRHFLPKDLSEKYLSLFIWFKSLQKYLDTSDVPLYKVSGFLLPVL